jgi:hypothetical protein
MEAIIDGKEGGRWNWEHNHCLKKKKMYTIPWPIGIRHVYKTLCEGKTARKILMGKYTDQMKKRGKQCEMTKIYNELHLGSCY